MTGPIPTTSAPVIAREKFGLAVLDRELSEHAKTMPPPRGGLEVEWFAWEARRAEIVLARVLLMKSVKGLICQRCGGTGRVQWTRSNHLCYRCNGDGFTAKGRAS